MKTMTIKDLKEQIKNLPDEMEVIMRSDNFELQGSFVAANRVSTPKMTRTKETFIDGFDYGRYQAEIYKSDEEGTRVFTLNQY